MARLFNILAAREFTKIQIARYGKKTEHWAAIKRKKTAKYYALKHFDDFYNNVYEKKWEDIKEALLQEEHKYVAVVNSFSDIDRIKMELELQGAMNLKMIYQTYKEEIDKSPRKLNKKKKKRNPEESLQMDSVIADVQINKIQSHYPAEYTSKPSAINTVDEDENDIKEKDSKLEPVVMKSIETNLNTIELDENRIVHPNSTLSGLYEFVPATQIKGMEDWILESQHYSYYNQSADFSVNTEEDPTLIFPEYLNIYTFEMNNDSRFPPPKKGSTDLLDYYLLDGTSILPVLALDLQPGDAVLDMCAAPGGKSLTILQTLMPRLLVANDLQLSRVKRIKNVMTQFINGIGQWQDRVCVTQQDARAISDKDMYNKILVDVPCTTDRHVLHSDENNIFKPTRIQERLTLPEVQANILTNALKIVAVGGIVVYSTCTLSPIQNDGVVGMALKKAWEETNSTMVVKDMTRALKPLKCLYKFGDFGLKYGHIAIPTLENNWGPMYFCKITRVK